MSDHHHDHSHSSEKKPVSFTVPFILASVTLLAIIMFLSLCDPKPHHGGGCEDKCGKECSKDGGCSKECEESCNGHDEDHNSHEAKVEEAHSDNADTEKASEEKAAETSSEEAHH